MKDTILQTINAVLNALNTISVSGKQNLANLSGSIAALEDLYGAVYKWTEAEAQEEKK